MENVPVFGLAWPYFHHTYIPTSASPVSHAGTIMSLLRRQTRNILSGVRLLRFLALWIMFPSRRQPQTGTTIPHRGILVRMTELRSDLWRGLGPLPSAGAARAACIATGKSSCIFSSWTIIQVPRGGCSVSLGLSSRATTMTHQSAMNGIFDRIGTGEFSGRADGCCPSWSLAIPHNPAAL